MGRHPSQRVLLRKPNAEQTVRIRIDPWDLWNMPEALADIILPMLKQLYHSKQSVPAIIRPLNEVSNNYDRQYCFDWYKDDDHKAWELGKNKWCEILEQMIWSFEQISNRNRDNQFHEANGFNQKDYINYYEKIQEGLNLFSKYYMNLWD